MGHSAIRACCTGWLVLSLALGGCALQPRHPVDPDHPDQSPLPASMGESWRAPLVLRPGAVAVNMQAPTRKGRAPGLAAEVFWLSVTALFTFGGPLLDLPNVVARHQTSELDLPKDCAQSWTQLMTRPQWLAPPEERTSALQALADAMRSDLDRRGQALTIEIEPTSADDPRSTPALAEIGRRLSVPALAVADVLFAIEPQPKQCAMLMRVSAQMHLDTLGADAKPAQAVSFTRATSVAVPQWARDPGVGNEALRGLLDRIGADIVRALPAQPAR